MRPPGKRKAKFKDHLSKVIFFGYDPHTTLNVLYYDVDSHRIKLASHVRFDEAMNYLPMADTPLNVQHLQRVNNGQLLPKEKNVPASQFELSISPFIDLLHFLLKSTPYYPDPTFGFTFQYYDLLKRVFVNNSKVFSNPRSTKKSLRGAFVTSIHGTRVLTSSDTLK